LTGIEIKIDGIHNSALLLQGGRQKFHQDALTITKEPYPYAASENNIPAVFQKYLQPSPLVVGIEIRCAQH